MRSFSRLQGEAARPILDPLDRAEELPDRSVAGGGAWHYDDWMAYENLVVWFGLLSTSRGMTAQSTLKRERDR